ncbi:MAG TPA: hypothetical protein VEK07_18230 [Polyangiaceae bacterium]|nr:hypothetical protein [Polyangiaceae bacterium]
MISSTQPAMTGIQCPFCGQVHPPESRFCPATGRALAVQVGPAAPPHAVSPPHPRGHFGAAAVAPPQHLGGPQPPQPLPPAYGVAPQSFHGAAPQPAHGAAPQPAQSFSPHAAYGAAAAHGSPQPAGYAPAHGPSSPWAVSPNGGAPGQATPIGALLAAAFDLYRKNLVALVATCAVLIAPLALVHAGITALLLAPTVAVHATATDRVRVSEAAAERLRRDVEEAQRDPARAQQLQRDEQKQLQDLSRTWTATEAAAVGGLAAIALALLAVLLGIAIQYGIAVPLTTAALTIVVLDRAAGGDLGPARAYRKVASRLPALLTAAIPAVLLVLLGLCLLVIPGLVLGLLFVFVTPVVMIENLGGIAALKRSATLVKANVLQVLAVGLVFAAIRLVASIFASVVVPRTAFFAASLVQDVLLLFLLPIPIVGTVLVYLDIRKQTEGLDERRIRQALGA